MTIETQTKPRFIRQSGDFRKLRYTIYRLLFILDFYQYVCILTLFSLCMKKSTKYRRESDHYMSPKCKSVDLSICRNIHVYNWKLILHNNCKDRCNFAFFFPGNRSFTFKVSFFLYKQFEKRYSIQSKPPRINNNNKRPIMWCKHSFSFPFTFILVFIQILERWL